MTDQPIDYSTIPKYKIGAVSRLTGLSVDVVRVWQRRYQAVIPQRSEGGSRLYSDLDIARLRKLRQAVELGHSISQIAGLPDSELETLGSKQAATIGAFSLAEQPPDQYAILRDRFLSSIERFDVVAADEEINRAATLYPPRLIVKHVVIPLLIEIGERWAHKDFGIAHEHVATNLIRNLLSSLFRLYPPNEGADSIVLATHTGERHEFGILIAALIAATRGWRVIYLGIDLPAAEIVRAVKLSKSRLLLLSAIHHQNGVTAQELNFVGEQVPHNCRVWIAGAEAYNHRPLIEQFDWILVRDFDDLDDRLKR
ncbi:MAG: MerR family transcriptional regulator [Acidobacteriota bacterium]|nr:MerR family transcriptional regulator [Acidobacteriota bacterium]